MMSIAVKCCQKNSKPNPSRIVLLFSRELTNKNLEKNNGPRRNIVADYHRCNLIILLLENKSHKILFTNRRFWLVRLVGWKMVAATSNIELLSGRLLMTSVLSLNGIGWKLPEWAHLGSFWLVGWACLHTTRFGFALAATKPDKATRFLF